VCLLEAYPEPLKNQGEKPFIALRATKYFTFSVTMFLCCDIFNFILKNLEKEF
jgi:hypothetical protein